MTPHVSMYSLAHTHKQTSIKIWLHDADNLGGFVVRCVTERPPLEAASLFVVATCKKGRKKRKKKGSTRILYMGLPNDDSHSNRGKCRCAETPTGGGPRTTPCTWYIQSGPSMGTPPVLLPGRGPLSDFDVKGLGAIGRATFSMPYR